MRVPNWIHHSKKDPKRKLKPQALRQAKVRRQAHKRKYLKTAFLIFVEALHTTAHLHQEIDVHGTCRQNKEYIEMIENESEDW